MKRLLPLMLVLCLVLPVLVGSRCGDDDDDDTASETTPPPGACDENTAPELIAAQWFVDGAAAGEEPTLAEYEEAMIYLAYADAECNLGGGRVVYWVDDEAPSERQIDTEAPCEGTADEQFLGFDVAHSGVGGHTLHLFVKDRCGAASGTVELPFSLTAAEPPTDDDDSTGDDDTVVEPTLLIGAIDLVDEEAKDYTGRPVNIYLFASWLPGGELPVAATQTTVPEAGFPYDYEWDLDAAEVAAGDYYVFAYLNVADEDGLFNPEADPVHAPYLPITIATGQTATANLTLVFPAE
jgi:hypothetical protein